MHLKQILILFICLGLIFPGQSWALPETSNPVSSMLGHHREIIQGVGSLDLIVKHGKNLSDATFKLLSDPKNKKYLDTPEGREIRIRQEKLNNFLAVKDHFEKCVKDKNNKRKIDSRILDASLQSMAKIEDSALPCLPSQNSMYKNFQDFNNDIMKSMKNMVKPYFQNQLSKQIMSNTAKSLLVFRQKFSPDFMNKGYLTQPELNSLVSDVCFKKTKGKGVVTETDVCQKMDPNFKTLLSKELISFSKLQKNEKLPPEAATIKLNGAIDRLNTSLDKIKVTKDVGYIYDSADMANGNTKKEFDMYVNQYMTEVSKEAGSLLLSKTIKDESGSIRRFDNDEIEKNKKLSRFEFIKHKKVKLEDVKNSISEIEKKMMTQAHDTLDMASNATRSKGLLNSDDKDLSELVKINPFAAGQVLLNEPQYAGLMCDTINRINQTEVDDANFDKYFTIGSAVLGGALLLTGVGTMAGAYLITGSLTAGIAAGTVGGSIIGYSAVAGTVVELGNLTYFSKKSYDSYQEMNKLEQSFLTASADPEAILEAKNALIEFKDARFRAVFALANMGINAFSAFSVFNILKVDPKVSPDKIKAASKIMRYISETRTAQKLKNVALILGDKGMEKLDLFLLQLAKIGEVSRVKFLELLTNAKMTPEKIKEIIEAALDAAKNCSKT